MSKKRSNKTEFDESIDDLLPDITEKVKKSRAKIATIEEKCKKNNKAATSIISSIEKIFIQPSHDHYISTAIFLLREAMGDLVNGFSATSNTAPKLNVVLESSIDTSKVNPQNLPDCFAYTADSISCVAYITEPEHNKIIKALPDNAVWYKGAWDLWNQMYPDKSYNKTTLKHKMLDLLNKEGFRFTLSRAEYISTAEMFSNIYSSSNKFVHSVDKYIHVGNYIISPDESNREGKAQLKDLEDILNTLISLTNKFEIKQLEDYSSIDKLKHIDNVISRK